MSVTALPLDPGSQARTILRHLLEHGDIAAGREEDAARAARVGLWQTDVPAPWEYRAQRWAVAAQEAPGGCPIKGNINRDGERI